MLRRLLISQLRSTLNNFPLLFMLSECGLGENKLLNFNPSRFNCMHHRTGFISLSSFDDHMLSSSRIEINSAQMKHNRPFRVLTLLPVWFRLSLTDGIRNITGSKSFRCVCVFFIRPFWWHIHVGLFFSRKGKWSDLQRRRDKVEVIFAYVVVLKSLLSTSDLNDK